MTETDLLQLATELTSMALVLFAAPLAAGIIGWLLAPCVGLLGAVLVAWYIRQHPLAPTSPSTCAAQPRRPESGSPRRHHEGDLR